MTDTQPALVIDPLDPDVFLRACAAFDAVARLAPRRRSTDAPALPAALWRPDTKKKVLRNGNR